MTTASPIPRLRDAIERDLADEPQSIIRVYETGRLRTDLVEYVLTDTLAREFAKVLERVVESARPAGGQTDKVGVWVSGFFGSGKSHFTKLVGHLLADTNLGNATASELFANLLHSGRAADERLREVFQQAKNYRLSSHVVAFDISALHTAIAERNVGVTFLRAFYESLNLSKVIAFAERETELTASGQHGQFLELFEQKSGVPWEEEKDLASSSAMVAECLAELMPERYRTAELAHQSLELAMREVEGHFNIDGVVDRLLRWLDSQDKQHPAQAHRIIFLADEVGAWAGRNQDRIEQIRPLVETLGTKGQGRIWLVATSQERLSAVVQNASIADSRVGRELLQRLEARFQTNVHLESSEVGTVIEDRILRKRPTAVPALEQLWTENQQQLRDIAESPGLELGANYSRSDKDPFVRDYPFLPYQLQAAADIFGGMRGVRISSGARSMIGVAFDSVLNLADAPLGHVVSWDQIFDSANRDNEFADEQYLGSQGLEYIRSADRDVLGTPVSRPSRLLKTLWLAQQTARIPRTPQNLARLLVNELTTDVLELERDVEGTLVALANHNFVRREPGTGQWKFLTQDEVTVEKIVRRIAEDLKQKEVRDAVFEEYAKQLRAFFNGRITMGKSNTAFDHGLYLNNAPLRNEKAPVKLRADLVANAAESKRIAEESALYLESPEVRWVLSALPGLEDRLRRVLAIQKLPNDEEYRRIATERTRSEADKLQAEADELRSAITSEVEKALQSGTIHWGGNETVVDGASSSGAGRGNGASAKAKVEEALRDRIAAQYHRFGEGDRVFLPANVEKLFTAPSGDRASLDPDLGIFSPDGHVHGNHVLVEELAGFLRSSTKTSGQDITDKFDGVPYGWPSDLLRYVAAAMFVDGKLSAIDRAGKRYDDPKAAGTRALFGTAAFRSVRLEVEEDALTPEESTQARSLLIELGYPPADGGEVALREAALQLTGSLSKRLSVVEKARQVAFPLPESYEAIAGTVDVVGASASRVKVIRALLAHAQALRDAAKAMDRLDAFDKHFGFDQYRRSQDLLAAAIQAGLSDDEKYGPVIQAARDELEALRTQGRVLDEWDGPYAKYRLDVLDSFKAVYAPLREELHQRSADARTAVTEMPEYLALGVGDRALIRVEYLGDGKPLQDVPLPELRDEQQLLRANAEYTIPHMRVALAAIGSQVAQAQERVIELHTAQSEREGAAAKLVAWKPAEAFSGKRFATEAEVDAAFDPEKERLKALVRDGKTVQVV